MNILRYLGATDGNKSRIMKQSGDFAGELQGFRIGKVIGFLI